MTPTAAPPEVKAEPKKLNRHVVIALNHMNKRKETLTAQVHALEKEIEDLQDAINALNPE